MAKSKGRPVNIPGPVKCAQFGSKSRITGKSINLVGLGMPLHRTSHSHKNRDRLGVSVENGTIKMPITNHFAEKFPHLDIEWDGSHVQKRFHSGRTDSSYGHYVFTNPTNNRGEALGAYHFHHTLGPHIPCCRGSGNEQAASIINPYTGSEIALGKPYIFEGQAYFSMNRVSMAISTSNLGVSPSLNNRGGAFFACNLGIGGGIGDLFGFSYPTNFLGIRQNNTHFFTNCGRIELLCHTSQASLDPFPIFAYVSLETIRSFMLSEGFFTSFAPDDANIWRFTYPGVIRGILTPQNDEHFQIGDILTVKVATQDTATASMIVNGRIIESKYNLNGRREIVFNDYELTPNDVGILTISVNARNRGGTHVEIAPVVVRVGESQYAEPYVWIFDPEDGDAFTVGDSVSVSAFVERITQAELRIGDYRQSSTHPFNYQGYNTTFQPYTFTAEDVGSLQITVTATNNDGQSAADTIRVQVTRGALSNMMENLAQDTSINVESATRRNSMVTIGQGMLERGFEAAFVAGMLGNVMEEGSIGEFERAGTQPYMQYVINYHDYINRFHGRHVYNVDATLQELYNIISNRMASAGNNVNLFGLGTMQFTNGSRILHIVENYMLVSGGSGSITREQAAEAEILTLIQQLEGYGQHTGPAPPGISGWGFNLYEYWISRHASDMNTVAAARDAAQLIVHLFLRPGDAAIQAEIRSNNAADIFHVMMQ